MKNYFTKKPTDELILKALRSIGLRDFYDGSEVSAKNLNREMAEEVLEDMKGCYFQCYKDVYTGREFSFKNYLIIMRHLIRFKNRRLIRHERCVTVSHKVYEYITTYSLDSDASPVVVFQ